MLKRLFDVGVATSGLLLLSPLLLVIAVLVKLSSPGPALYRAVRTGRNGASFQLLKFRTMVLGADRLGPGITSASDQRITPIGRILRRTKIDELPQLFNVLRGDMSLVGPRPEDPRYVALYTPEQRQVLSVRPGITSLASVAYRNESALLSGPDWENVYVEQVMPAKLALDLDYARNPTLRKDISILLQTVRALFQ